MIGKLGTLALATVVGFGITAQSAQATAVSTADALIASQFIAADQPFVFEDTNWNLASAVLPVGPAGAPSTVVAGFIDFEFVGSSDQSIAVTPIRDVTEGSSKAALNSVEITGFFAAQVIGLGSNPELGAPGGPAAIGVTTYLAPIPTGSDLSSMFGRAPGSVLWSITDPGAVVKVFADLADDFNASSPGTALDTTVDGEDYAEIGFTTTPTTSATYVAGDEYFANVYQLPPPQVVPTPADQPLRLLASLNILNTTSSILDNAVDNDTGNTFYAEGTNVGGGQNGFFFQGDVDAKILAPVPLPAAVWAGLPLLGFAATVRRRITRS